MVFTLLERKGTEWHRLPSLAAHSTPQPGAHRCEYTFLERSTWTRLAQHPWTSAPKSCGIASRRTQTEHNPKTGQKEKSGDEPPRRQPAPSFPMKPQHGIGTHGVQGTVSGSQAEVCERAAPAQEALQALEKRWSSCTKKVMTCHLPLQQTVCLGLFCLMPVSLNFFPLRKLQESKH